MPNATLLLRKLRAISPQSILGPCTMESLQELPTGVSACSKHQLKRELRYLQQLVGTASDQPLLQFWTKVHGYKDLSGSNPMVHLAAGAMTFIVVPIFNAEAERVF